MSEEGMAPAWWEEACAALVTRDAELAPLILQARPPAVTSSGDAFTTLARAIVGQQLSVKAARRVWERLEEGVGSVSPQTVLQAGAARLREAGLSGAKASWLVDLAEHFAAGRLDPRCWREMDDETIVRTLITVRGIGRWTAEMFLIFHLWRPDVWPIDDLGLRRALVRHAGLPEKAPRRVWLEAGERWRPWRTAATWILWRSLEAAPVIY